MPKIIVWDYDLQLAFMRKAPIDWPYTKDSGCVLWRGNFDVENGYPRLFYKNAHIVATRISLMLFLKLKIFDQCALHCCDNPPCINPWHLFPGMNAENARDKSNKGRNNVPKGESHGRSKLTALEVEYIRHQVKNGRTQKSLAIELGVHFRTISNISNGQTWQS